MNKVVYCPECGGEVAENPRYIPVLNVLDGESPYKCRKCGKGLERRNLRVG